MSRSDPRWRRLRRRILDAANWRCSKCGGYANEVDHITPLKDGGPEYAPANLQAICRSCHIEKTRGENCREPSPAEAAWRSVLEDLLR